MSRRRRRGGCRRWLIGAAVLLVVVAGWLGWRLARWPDVAALAAADPPTTAFFERARERAAREGERAPQRQPVRWKAISVHAKHAVVASEDIDFFAHQGFAWGEVEQAVRDRIDRGRPLRGASTITQQLAKNLWLSPSRNPLRKLEEVILTWQLERALSKRRILELYLNAAEMGPGVWGIEAGARRYFGKSAADLTRREAAQLAAGLPRPASWHPGSESQAYARRVERLVKRMEGSEWLLREIRAADGQGSARTD